MQSFSANAWRGANNAKVSEPLRYTAQRLPELLDPHAHFGRSASFKLDPATALRELISLASAHTSTRGRNPSTGVVLDAVHNTRDLIESEAHLADWFEGEREAALAAMTRCTDLALAKRNGLNPRKWLSRELPSAARGPLLAMRNVLEAAGGYRHRLLAHVESQAVFGIATAPGWRAFDTDLQNLASLLLVEGRSGMSLGKETARVIANAPDSAAALMRLREIWTAEARPFLVAFHLPRVRHPKNLTAFGCRKARARSWEDGRTRKRADERLREFVKGRDSAILTEVHAFDFDQAQTKAFDVAERLADQYGARHRTYTFEVSPEMLLLRTDSGGVMHFRNVTRTPPHPRALLAAPNEALEQSFRYGALARSERSPIVRILHSWIALEALASEPTAPQRPYRFLQTHLAPALSLQAVRHGIAASWQIASRAGRKGPHAARWAEVERWLGIKNSKGRTLDDLNDWTRLLRGRASRDVPKSLPPDASARDAAALFNQLLRDFPPFPRKTVEYWQWMLKKGPRLSNWCAGMELQARTTLNRMYVVRNFSVHKALTKSDGAGQLSHAAHNVVDAVYEFLPPWLEPNRPTWKALDGLRRRSQHVRRAWGANRRATLINAERLTRPGGDGLR